MIFIPVEQFIKKVGNSYVVHSESGKPLSKHLSLAGAKKRLAQIEYFKAGGKPKGGNK